MGSLLEFVQIQMKPVSGKARLSDLVLARREMPDTSINSMGAVPDCIIEGGEIDPQRLTILAWIQMRREKPELTQDEVSEMISLARGEIFVDFIKKIYWFWSDLDEDEFERRWAKRMEASRLTPLEETEEVTEANPTPSESS